MKSRRFSGIVALFLCAATFASCAAAPAVDGTKAPTEEEKQPMINYLSEIKASDGEAIRIACVGDSITYGHGTTDRTANCYPSRLSALLGNGYKVGNFGKNSSYLLSDDNPFNVKSDVKRSYKDTQEYKDSVEFAPDVVIINLSSNDVRSMSSSAAVAAVKEAFIALIADYKAMPTVQKVFVMTTIFTPNSVIIAQLCTGLLQEIEREVAAEADCPVIDMFALTEDYYDTMMHTYADCVHPNDNGYEPVANAVYSVLTGTEYVKIEADKSESGVVYYSSIGGVGGGCGESPEKPTSNLAYAAGMLRDGGTIVVVDKCSLGYEAHMPHNTKKITVTSVFGGVDYREKGAAIGLAKDLYLNGEYEFKNVNFVCTTAASFYCNYNNAVFGDGIVCEKATNTAQNPAIIVGMNIVSGGVTSEAASLHRDCSVTVNSGSYSYIKCGNRKGGGTYTIGTIDSGVTLSVTVNGGEFTNAEGLHMTTATGTNGVDGRSVLTINGGKFAGNVYAVGLGVNSADKPIIGGEAALVINGGDFGGDIIAVQNPDSVTVNGKCTCSLSAEAESLRPRLSGFAE